MKLKKFFTAGWKGDVIAVLAGAMLTLAFAPFQIFPLAVLSPAILLCTWLFVTREQAFFRGWLFGLGLFGTGIYWVFISIHTFGNASILLSTVITVGLINIVALFPALSGYALTRFFPKNNYAKINLAFPAIWVFLEWCRSWLFTGFTWLTLGYSQSNSFLRGYASLFGVYAVSLTVLVSSGLLLSIIMKRREKKPAPILKTVLILILIWVAGFGLSHITWTHASGKPVKVSMVQGDIPQQVKWSTSELRPTLQRYGELTNQHLDSQIIIWPEGAIPMPLQAAESFINHLDEVALKHNATLITGIPVRVPDTDNYYNAVVAMGKGKGVYLKRRLVPFGEYTPFSRFVKPLLDSLKIPMSDFISGPLMPDSITAGNIKISTFICYEIAFPEQVMSRNADIGMILTVSDDAWFGHSIAQAQHLQMAQMRAIEMGRPVLSVSNDGLTAAIDEHGFIYAIAPPFEPYVLTTMVQPRTGLTLWQTGGMDPVLLTILLMIVFARRHRFSHF